MPNFKGGFERGIKGQAEKFESIGEALKAIQGRLRIGIEHFAKKSIILKNFGVQRKIGEWI